ncbi:ATP-binding cassette, subfamily C [Paenibacillus sp. 1_12]|uniref:ABC transporter ATP-binding protein n=1 Tax=Paenibacillus sp. 1_12 TaxID=1566278 RepID=UPI0008E79D48|nr:ABC transporter ATP-binding protein [Paenibacillus sp. 1_12]SFL15935.1 ATP-binding cassette, subfamily C [Paenibacillus sp. 1_12]
MKQIIYFTKQLYAFTGKLLYINLIGMVLISFMDGIGIILLIPLISVSGILDVNTSTSPVEGVFQFLQQLPAAASLPIILGIYLVLVLGQSFLQRNLTIQDAKIHTRFINHLRLQTYRAILQANWSFFVKKRKSDLVHSLTGELGQVTGGIQLFLQLLSSITFTSIQLAIAFWLSAKVTSFVLICGFLLLLCSRKFIYRSKALGGQLQEMAKSYLAGITDHFNGIKDIKSNRLEAPRYEWLRTWSAQIEKERIKQVKLATHSQLLYKISSAVLITIFIYVSITFFHSEQAQMVMILVIFSRLWPRFTSIQSNMESIASILPVFKTLIELQEECKEAEELMDIELQPDGKIDLINLQQGITCNQVYFRYSSEGALYALQDVNVTIPSLQTTAIVGKSGAGKSTLIDILMGLTRPEKGQVLLDDTPLTTDNLMSFRHMISYVAQDPFLFNASIRENLLMIAPRATEQHLWEALEFAAVDDMVRKLPQGLDTFIGDRGVRLSGGERQRLVLARAILKKPYILVLDEATSALDTENEGKIQQALEKLKGKMTIIVIAHRLSTIRNADQVIVLEEGKIIQTGKFDQLAEEKGGVFASLLGNQMPA